MSTSAIVVQNLAKLFSARGRTIRAVDDLSFSVRRGSIFGLLGPNGAGKTTTLRMLAALIAPDAGRMSVDGIDVVARPREALARMGVLSDARGLYPRLTARENIVYYGRLQGMARDAANVRAETLARLFEMTPLLERRTEGFSQGERMKTALARALVHDPANIVLDEPTNGLDVLATRALRDALRLLRTPEGGGKCIVFSTHIMQEVERLCDSVIVMAHGRTVASGTVQSLLAQTGERDFEEAFVKLAFVEERAAARRALCRSKAGPRPLGGRGGVPVGRGAAVIRDAFTVFRKEIVDALRDRRTLMVVLMSSVLLGPLVLVALSAFIASFEERAEKREVHVAGIEQAPTLANWFERQTYVVKKAPADFEARLRRSKYADPVVVVPPDFEAALKRGEAPVVEVVSDSANKQAEGGAARIQRLLQAFGRERATLNLALRGVSPELVEPMRIEERDLASAQTRATQVTGMLPFFVLMAVLYGALNAALDTTAGERERGSLEPLLMRWRASAC